MDVLENTTVHHVHHHLFPDDAGTVSVKLDLLNEPMKGNEQNAQWQYKMATPQEKL